jgi:hypothetical protein
MSSGIYLLQSNEDLIKMTEETYDSEQLLQEILAKYPDLLAGDQINQSSPRRWLFIAREIGIPGEEEGANRWSLDHLFLDQDAIPTFVEVKRSDDLRIRRQVVGQMLDYAANATVYWSVEVIKTQFELQCQAQNNDPNIILETFLEAALDSDEYWQTVKINLQAGRIRLIFLADHIPDELRRIVEFLNRQMDPAEVLAIEIPQYTGQGLKCLVPRVMGQAAEAQQKKSGGGSKRQWDELTYFEELQKRNNPVEIQAAQQLLTWAKQSATRVYWGIGKRLGSFVPIVTHRQRDHQLFAVWTSGTVEIYFYWYAYKPPFESEDARLQLLAKLNAIEGIQISEENIVKRPSIPLSVFTSPALMRQFIEVFEWFIESVKTSP